MMTAASKLAVSSEIPHMGHPAPGEPPNRMQLLLDEMDKYSLDKNCFSFSRLVNIDMPYVI